MRIFKIIVQSVLCQVMRAKDLFCYQICSWGHDHALTAFIPQLWQLVSFPGVKRLIVYILSRFVLTVTVFVPSAAGKLPFLRIGSVIVSDFESIVAVAAAKVSEYSTSRQLRQVYFLIPLCPGLPPVVIDCSQPRVNEVPNDVFGC